MHLCAATLLVVSGLSAGAKKPLLAAEEQLALERMAQRRYDACQTGPLDDPGPLLQKLDRTRY
jgi:hypothetical protein